MCHASRHLHHLCRRFIRIAPSRAQFAHLTADDVLHFRQIVPDGVQHEDNVERYNVDWLKQWHGSASLVLRPSTTLQVSSILKHCNSRRLAVCPQGGNTGLVGGGVPAHDEIILSLERMNCIKKFDSVSGTMVCEAGCILENLDNYAAEKGFMMPLDLGAKGSCQIGGNVSTNAGGLRFLRYGSLRQSVLGLTAVRADGTVVDLTGELKKDNTGYDLKQLFIGSEGTLGVITEVCLQLPTRPPSTSVALVACPSFKAVQATFTSAKRLLAEVLSAVEFMDAKSVESLLQVTGASFPIDPSHPFYIVFETHGSKLEHDQKKLMAFLESASAEGHVVDGTVAQSGKDARALWSLREGLPPAMTKVGYLFKYDISLPVPVMYDLVEAMRQRLEQHGRTDAFAHGYGHLGDSNLHMNVVAPRGFDRELEGIIEPFVYEWAQQYRGSISAEHGIGQLKRSVLHLTKSQSCIRLMAQLKAMMDPNGILNPYKVLPETLDG